MKKNQQGRALHARVAHSGGRDRVWRWLQGLLAGAVALWSGSILAASCTGTDLMAAMPGDEQTRLEAAVGKVPYHQGVLWRATRGDAEITLVGTLHLDDPRHHQTLDRLSETLDSAAALYVEAGPEEMAKLNQALAEGTLLLVDEGTPALSQRLNPDEWEAVSSAMAERGIPPQATAVLRPWFVMLMLGMPPCLVRSADGSGDLEGLDGLLIERAQQSGLPIHALEPWETLFTMFSDLTGEQELDMIRASILAGTYADDYAVTLTEAYFAGDVWSVWEFMRLEEYRSARFTRDEVDEQFALAQSSLMDQRNQQWLGPLTAGAEAAAAEEKGIVAGFGALHLPGEQGVLKLLERDGWAIERLD